MCSKLNTFYINIIPFLRFNLVFRVQLGPRHNFFNATTKAKFVDIQSRWFFRIGFACRLVLINVIDHFFVLLDAIMAFIAYKIIHVLLKHKHLRKARKFWVLQKYPIWIFFHKCCYHLLEGWWGSLRKIICCYK